MSQIKDYKLLGEITGTELFVVESSEGTRRVPASMIVDTIRNAIDDSGINSLTERVDEAAATIAQIQKSIERGDCKGIDNVYIENNDNIVIALTNRERIVLRGILASNHRQYGVCRDMNSHTPTLERVGDAVNLVANVGVGTSKVRNDFDDIYPWSKIRKCTVDVDGTVTSYEGDASYIEDGSIGQVMVEIPKFYIKEFGDEIANKDYTYICKEKLNGYRLPQAFYNKNGDELDTIYIGAYIGSENENGDLESVSGLRKYISAGHNLEYFRNAATKSRNNNWHLFDAMEYSDVIVPLFTIEFATLDSLSVMQGYKNSANLSFVVANDDINKGKSNILKTYNVDNIDDFTFIVGQEIIIPYNYENIDEVDDTDDIDYWVEMMDDTKHNAYAVRRITNITTAVDDVKQCNYIVVEFSGSPIYAENGLEIYLQSDRCGMTNEIRASSGYIKAKTKDLSAFVYRGLENLYGSGYGNWLDGILCTTGTYNICEDITKYSRTVTDDYVALSYDKPSLSGYITQLGTDAEHPWAKFPSALGGTSEQDYCDYISTAKRSGTIASPYGYCFGNNDLDSSCGLLAAVTKQATSNNGVVARLSYKSFN